MFFTWGIFIVSLFLFYLIGRFTLKLIRQHYDVYGLLYALEEEEKEK